MRNMRALEMVRASKASKTLAALGRVAKPLGLAALAAACLLAGSCRSRTDKSPGPVVLTFGTITGVPFVVPVRAQVSANAPVVITTFTIQSVVKDPSALINPAIEDVEVTSYQVVFKRRDSGTRVPPPLVGGLGLSVPVNSTGIINNLAIVRFDQLESEPLLDLLNNGQDSETGTAVIVCDAQITFFGQTLSGDSVQSGTAVFTLEFTP
jgi:hypothetical protein